MKTNKFLVSLGLCTAAGVLIGKKKADAWFSDTHSAIFESALEILKNDNKYDAYKFFEEHKDRILYGVVVPDFKGDRNKGSGMHYYSSCDKNGKEILPTYTGFFANRLGKYAPSARTMLEENYTMSFIQFANNMTDMALDSLGRCIHFISDIGCTVHTSNLISLPLKNNPHHCYEKYALANMDRFHTAGGDKRLYDAYLNKSIGEMLNILSRESAKYYADVKAVEESTFENALSNMLPMTEQHVAAFMNSYYERLSENVEKALKVKSNIRIKSVCDEAYLTIYENGRAGLSKLNDNLNQTFNIRLNLDGSVRIVNKDGNLLCDGMFGFKCGKAIKNNGFRLSESDGFYKISTEYSRFSKLLTNSKRLIKYRVFQKEFNPLDDGQLWVIEKV